LHILYPHHDIVVEQISGVYSSLHGTTKWRVLHVRKYILTLGNLKYCICMLQTLYSMTQNPVQNLQSPLEAHLHVPVDSMVAMPKGKLSAFYTTLCCKLPLLCLWGQLNWKLENRSQTILRTKIKMFWQNRHGNMRNALLYIIYKYNPSLQFYARGIEKPLVRTVNIWSELFLPNT